MKQFFVFINDETVGPFPQDEIEAKIKSGEYPYDVLIADADKENASEDDWVEAVDLLHVRRAGVGLRMAGKSDEEEKRLREAREEKIDPEVRVKLMRYGLADSISVDKFSPEQAVAAVEFYEKAQKRSRMIKLGVGIGGFVLATAIFSLVFNIELGGKEPNRKLLAPVVELMVSPSEKLVSYKQTVAKEIMQLEELRQEVAAVEFVLPKGKAVGDTFENMVQIPNDQREYTTATVDFNALKTALGEISDLEILLPKSGLSSSAKKMLGAEIEERILLNSPRWTDAELSNNAVQELGPLLPTSKNVKAFANKLLDMLGNLKCETALEQPDFWAKGLVDIVKKQDSRHIYYFDSELTRIMTRADNRGNLPSELSSQMPRKKDLEVLPQDGSGKSLVVAWACREMPAFLDKFHHYLNANIYNFSEKARQERWEKFRKTETGEVNAEIAKLKDVPAIKLDETATFTIAGNQGQLRNVCLRLKCGEDILTFPTNVEFNPAGPSDLVGKAPEQAVAFELTDIKNRKTTKADLLQNERYIVNAKVAVGGTPYFREGLLNGKKIQVVKCAPKLYYIRVTRVDPDNGDSKRRSREIVLGVPENDFNAIKEGDKLTVEQLSKYQIFNRPMEPQNKSQMRPMSKEQADEYFAKEKPESADVPAENAETEDTAE